MTTALEGGEGSASRPGRSLPPGNTRYPLYRGLGGPQGRSGQVRGNLTTHGDSIPGPSSPSQSLYRLSYPAHVGCTVGSEFRNVIWLECNPQDVQHIKLLVAGLPPRRPGLDPLSFHLRFGQVGTGVGFSRLLLVFLITLIN